MYVTPPSHRDPEGRGHGGLRKTEGLMPGEETTAPSGVRSQPQRTMGPVPTKQVSSEPVQAKASSSADREAGNGLQRALEAEMVTFLREQNEQLTEELARLKKQMTKVSAAVTGPTSTPSSWETRSGKWQSRARGVGGRCFSIGAGRLAGGLWPCPSGHLPSQCQVVESDIEGGPMFL